MPTPADKNAGGPPARKGAASARPVNITWRKYSLERDGYELRPQAFSRQTYT